MKERPIIFSAPMVRAILDGRKTQTRRVVTQIKPFDPCDEGLDVYAWTHIEQWPYRIGQILWVRETWQSAAAMNQCHVADDYYVYRATDPDWETMEGWKWRPSIYMPREASRILLEITGVRVERVQDISEDDAWSEGIKRLGPGGTYHASYDDELGSYNFPMAREAYKELWDSINVKRGYGWGENPWVWEIEFKQAEGEGE